jgi:hypothetical protein
MNQDNMYHRILRGKPFRQALARGLSVLAFLFGAAAFAGDLTALSWEEDSVTPTLQVWVSGTPAYTIEALDGGQRLRLHLPGTVLREVTDVDGRGAVKGVYPYLSDDGTGVNIDFLMNQAGALKIEPAGYGYRVVAQAGDEPPKAAAAKPEPKISARGAGPRAQGARGPGQAGGAAERHRGHRLREAPGRSHPGSDTHDRHALQTGGVHHQQPGAYRARLSEHARQHVPHQRQGGHRRHHQRQRHRSAEPHAHRAEPGEAGRLLQLGRRPQLHHHGG